MVSEEGGGLLCMVGWRGLFSVAVPCRGEDSGYSRALGSGTVVRPYSAQVSPNCHLGRTCPKPLGLSHGQEPFSEGFLK